MKNTLLCERIVVFLQKKLLWLLYTEVHDMKIYH